MDNISRSLLNHCNVDFESETLSTPENSTTRKPGKRACRMSENKVTYTLQLLSLVHCPGSEAKQVTEMRIAESFNKLSTEEVRPESACTYRLFQMQQTHKYADNF